MGGTISASGFGSLGRPFHKLPKIFSEVAKINPKSCRKVANISKSCRKVAPNLIRKLT